MTLSSFAQSVEANLAHLTAVSTGPCTGCEDCGLHRAECPDCRGRGYTQTSRLNGYELTLGAEVGCPRCDCATFLDVEPGDPQHLLHIDAQEIAGEASFSWSDCDSCGSGLGGDRLPAHGLNSKEELVHLRVCVDCVHYIANGGEPEGWPYR